MGDRFVLPVFVPSCAARALVCSTRALFPYSLDVPRLEQAFVLLL